MTVEKSVLMNWERVPGWATDAQARAFAQVLARKRSRFAFPEAFVQSVQKLRRRLIEKHPKHSDEGNALRALREIRVRAAPSWDAEGVELFFWFVREEDSVEVPGGKNYADWVESWMERISLVPPFTDKNGVVVYLSDMTAQEYVESDPLELDHLSFASPDD